MIPRGILDKYEIIKVLQETAATAVLLVRHKQIGEIRILKAVQISQPDSKRILSEANLMSGIKSPGIPTIFDVGQTDDFYYLVEEYVEGQSFEEYLLENDEIPLQKVLEILIEVCKIIEVLHSESDEPILYRDMKPEHIILQGNKIKLIDYGIAVKKSEARSALCYCSKSYAAPEQLKNDSLDERVDVYGIGIVAKEAMEKVCTNERYKLKEIVACATKANKEERVASVCELRERLERLQKKKNNELKEKKKLNRTLAIIGNSKSCGCTHISINLCNYLNRKGIECFYKAEDGEKNVLKISENLNGKKIKEGVLYHESFRGIMEYGPCVEAFSPPKGNYLLDYGESKKKDNLADIVIYVISMRPWQINVQIPEWVKDENVLVLVNDSGRISMLQLAKQLKKRVYQYPMNTRPFKISKNEAKLFDLLIREIGFEKD